MKELLEQLKALVASTEKAIDEYSEKEGVSASTKSFKVIRENGQELKKIGQNLRIAALEDRKAKMGKKK